MPGETLGEAYVEIKARITQLKKDLAAAKSEVKQAAKEMEKSLEISPSDAAWLRWSTRSLEHIERVNVANKKNIEALSSSTLTGPQRQADAALEQSAQKQLRVQQIITDGRRKMDEAMEISVNKSIGWVETQNAKTIAAQAKEAKSFDDYLNKRTAKGNAEINRQISLENKKVKAYESSLSAMERQDTKRFNDQIRKHVDTANSSNKSFKSQTASIKEASNEGENFNATLARLQRTLLAIATVVVFRELIRGFQTLVSSGIEFNKQIESAKLGIASILATQGEYVTQSGQQLQGVEKLNAAITMSDKLVNQLRIDNLKTTATFDQLVKAFQQTLAPGLSVGFNENQVRQYTLAMMQAASALGLNKDMMAEETRSMLKGTITARNTLIATSLGITNEQIRAFKGNAQGLFDFLMKKLKEFQFAGELSQKTFEGLFSNLKDAFMAVTGTSFEPLFNKLKEMMSGGIGAFITQTSTGLVANSEAVQFFNGIGDAIVSSINYLEEFGRGLLGMDQRFQNFDKHRDFFYKLGHDIRQVGEDIKPFLEQLGKVGGIIESTYNLIPEVIREDGLFHVILYGISRKHPFLAMAAEMAYFVDKAKEMSSFNKDNPYLKPDEKMPEGPAAFDKIQTEAQAARNYMIQFNEQANESNLSADGLTKSFKELEAQSMESGQAYGYFTDYLGQSVYKINDVKKSAEDLAKELDNLERAFNAFARGHFGLAEGIDDALRSSKIRLSVARSGLPSADQGVEVQYQERLDKIRDDVDKGIKAGFDISILMRDANTQMGKAFETRNNELATIAENEKNSQSKKLAKGPTLEFNKINQDFNSFEKKVRKIYQDLADIDDEYNIKRAEFSGDFYFEEEKRAEQWLRNQKERYDEAIITLQNSIQEMKDKTEKYGSKVDPKVWEGIRQKEEELNALIGQREKKVENMTNQSKEYLALTIKIREAERSENIAQLDEEYTKLTGTIKEQYEATVKLLEAERERAVLQNPALEGQIRRNYEEKIRDVKSSGSVSEARSLAQPGLEQANIIEHYQEIYDELERMRQNDLDHEAAYQAAKVDLWTQAYGQTLEVTSQFFSNLGVLFGEQSKAGKAMAIAAGTIDAILSSIKAYRAALDIPYVGVYVAPVFAAVAFAAQMAAVAKIQSAPTYRTGGYTGNFPRDEEVGRVHGQEFVVNAEGTRRNRDVLEAINRGQKFMPKEHYIPLNGGSTQAGAGKGGVNITIENYGTSKEYEQQITRDEIRIIAKDEVRKEAPGVIASEYSNPNSRVSKAQTRNTLTQRRRI